MENKAQRPAIYVACLAAYTSGHPHGIWIDATQDAWTIYDAVQAMLRTSPASGAEEWAIHDADGFGGMLIEEDACFERVSALAKCILEHGADEAALLAHAGADIFAPSIGAAVTPVFVGG